MRKQLLLAGALAAAGTAALPSFASAQAIEEVVVTARKREENLQNVPLVVQAFSAAQIERQGIRTLRDVAKLTPGLIFDRGISAQDTRPSIRGLPSTRGRPPVGELVDGIDISSQAFGNAGGGDLLNLRLFDLERIEVVKGPQSALYGRSAFAGAINYISKRPSKTPGAEANADIGSHGLVDLRGAVSGPLGDGSLTGRLTAAYAKYDGYAKNAITGGELEGFEDKGVGLAMEWKPSDSLDVYGRVGYSHNETDQRAVFPLSGSSGFSSRPLGGPEQQAVNAAIAGGVLAPGTLPSSIAPQGVLTYRGDARYSADALTGTDFPGSKSDTLLSTLNIDYKIGKAVLTSLTGYTNQRNLQDYDGDFWGAPATQLVGGFAEPLSVYQRVLFRNKYSQFSQELRLGTLSSDDRFRWAVGGLYWTSNTKQKSGSLQALGAFGATTVATYAQSGAGLYARSIPFATPRSREVESRSVYGVLEFEPVKNLTLTAEARYLEETSDVQTAQDPAATFAPVVSAATLIRNGSTKDDAFTPRLSAQYRFSERVMGYASAAKGYKPGGVNELNVGSTIADATYRPESLWNYEAGLKTSWLDDTLRINAAGFFMDWTDKQVNALVPDLTQASGYRTQVANAGAAEVYGLDMDAVWRPAALPGFVASAAYTYLHTEYTDYSFATTSALTMTEARQCKVVVNNGKAACFISLNGRELERAPKHAIVGTVNYTRTLSEGLTGLVEVSVQYRSRRYLEDFNNYIIPAGTNVDLRVGLQGPSWSAIVYGTNIFDNDKVTGAQENFDSVTFGRSVNVFKPTPAQVGVRLSKTF